MCSEGAEKPLPAPLRCLLNKALAGQPACFQARGVGGSTAFLGTKQPSARDSPIAHPSLRSLGSHHTAGGGSGTARGPAGHAPRPAGRTPTRGILHKGESAVGAEGPRTGGHQGTHGVGTGGWAPASTLFCAEPWPVADTDKQLWKVPSGSRGLPVSGLQRNVAKPECPPAACSFPSHGRFRVDSPSEQGELDIPLDKGRSPTLFLHS